MVGGHQSHASPPVPHAPDTTLTLIVNLMQQRQLINCPLKVGMECHGRGSGTVRLRSWVALLHQAIIGLSLNARSRSVLSLNARSKEVATGCREHRVATGRRSRKLD